MASEAKAKSLRSKSGRGGSSSGGVGGLALEKLKTVVRRLPPNLPEDVFWQSVQQWVTEETVSWKRFHQGKIRKRYNKENILSRAYIAFKNPEFLATFSQAYDGHVFRDKAGNESRAVVEFAPYQKVPTEKKKTDARAGTIEQDEDYISFIASITAAPTKPSDTETLEVLVASTQSAPEIKSTPLLEALLAEKSAAKDKEAILRNHAHYRDGPKRDRDDARKGGKGPGAAAAGSSRGGRGAPAATGAGDSVAGPSKKSRRGKRGEDSVQTASISGAPPGLAPGGGSRRERNQRDRDSSSKAAAVSSNPPQSGAQATPSQPIALISDDQPPTNTPTSPSVPRRRPVIGLGLQSRQFEAALSGAVPGGARSPRRERRDKEKEKSGTGEGPATTDAGSATAGAGGSGTSRTETEVVGGGADRKAFDGSRPRGGRRGDRGDKGANRDTTSTSPKLQHPPPKILRRDSISGASSNPVIVNLPQAATSDVRSASPFDASLSGGRVSGAERGGDRGRGGGRGGRRGRGRGRGGGGGAGGGAE